MVVKMSDIFYDKERTMWWPYFDHKPKNNWKMIKAGMGAIEVLLPLVPQKSVCVQAGGHLGYWPNRLAQVFKTVHTFEADPIVYQCLIRNLKGENIKSYSEALGSSKCELLLRRGASAGGSKIWPEGDIKVKVVTIDSLNLTACDAIILDIEGYEIQALEGAIETIKKFSPILHLEKLDHCALALDFYIYSIGYEQIAKSGRDIICRKKGNVI